MSSLFHKISFLIRKLIRKIRLLPKQYIDYFYLRYHGVETKFGYVKLNGFPVIKKCKGSRIILGKNLTIVSKLKYNLAGVFHRTVIATLHKDALITIGSGSGISGSVICAVDKISIGKFCAIGANVKIYDTDFHMIEPYSRINQNSIMEAKFDPVIIYDFAWIGTDCTILKGSIIGKGSVIGAASVVRGIIPEMEIHTGNPIIFIRKIKNFGDDLKIDLNV